MSVYIYIYIFIHVNYISNMGISPTNTGSQQQTMGIFTNKDGGLMGIH